MTSRTSTIAKMLTTNCSVWFRQALAFLAIAALTPGHVLAAAIWSAGHGDIGVAFDPVTSGTTFEMELHVGNGATVDGSQVTEVNGVVYEPGDAVVLVPVTANLKAIQSGSNAVWGGDTAGYDFVATGSSLGVGEGGNLWVLSFDEFDTDYYGTPFLGWATEEGFAGKSFGAVSFTPFSFTSPTGANFGIFGDDLSPLWILNHGDTNFSGDVFSSPADSHVHKVLAFTQPGIYQIGIRATSLLDGTTTVVGEGVYTFQVVPEPSSVVLAGVLAAGWRRRLAAPAGGAGWRRRLAAPAGGAGGGLRPGIQRRLKQPVNPN
jgi:surface-anchored protein